MRRKYGNHNTQKTNMTLGILNHKQQELARQLFETIHAQFPEITTNYTIRLNPENNHHAWIEARMPSDEVREADACDLMAQVSFQIWEETGYRISLFPQSVIEEHEFA
jgi:hypothetical protein